MQHNGVTKRTLFLHVQELHPSPMAWVFQPLADYCEAFLKLTMAERRCAPYPELLQLSTELIRTRNELAAHHLDMGTHLSEHNLRQIDADVALLFEPDDTDRLIALKWDPLIAQAS